MFDTPLLRARCNAFLAYLAVIGRINYHDVREDEADVVGRLSRDGKIKIDLDGWGKQFYFPVNTTPYEDDGVRPLDAYEGMIHPLVLLLAADSDKNEEYLRIHRKNFPQPAPLTAELSADTI